MKLPPKSTALTPHLTVRDVQAAARWYEEALGFRIKLMLPGGPSGEIRHAEVEHEGCTVMIGPESSSRGMLAPRTRGVPPSISLYLYVAEVDGTHARAIGAGAVELVSPSDQFFGARTSVIADPDGHQWMLAEHQQDMSEGEMRSVLRRDAHTGTAHSGTGDSTPGQEQGAPKRRRFSTS